MNSSSDSARLVLLATGGTIAGASTHTGADADAHYRSAQLSVMDLVAAAPGLAAYELDIEQVAQVDSKDMSHAIWQALALRVAHHLARPEVAGVLITHGTDTLEETAWFLQRVLAPTKPVVMVAAMRPATSIAADGPQNLQDAAAVASEPGARGVVTVVQGLIHGPWQVRKVHANQTDAFSSGLYGPLGRVVAGQVECHAGWPQGKALGVACIEAPIADWPRVALLISHAGLDAAWAKALVAATLGWGARGIVVEGTGNGTVHEALAEPLERARAQGVAVWRSTRCQESGIGDPPHSVLSTGVPGAGALTPGRARVELLLRLLAGQEVARGVRAADLMAS